MSDLPEIPSVGGLDKATVKNLTVDFIFDATVEWLKHNQVTLNSDTLVGLFNRLETAHQAWKAQGAMEFQEAYLAKVKAAAKARAEEAANKPKVDRRRIIIANAMPKL